MFATPAVCHAQSPTADTFNPGANNAALALAVQADGKILAGGTFTMLDGQTRNYIGRLNADGTLDTPFDPGAGSSVLAVAVQADGKILAGGAFTMLGGQARSRIGRLDPGGAVDATFNPGVNGIVRSLTVQADGKILVGGIFTILDGQTRNNIGRLTGDGTLDMLFDPGANSSVLALAVQADGKILAGGNFTMLGGQARNRIGRLNADGTVDTNFNPQANSSVLCMAVQADGKILAGGQFTTLGGENRSYIGRLNADGTLDTTFNPGANGWVYSITVQADGKILVGGDFTMLGGQARSFIGRLNADGSVDPTFDPGANTSVLSLGVQADGKILAGGPFNMLGGEPRSRIGRLNNTGAATQSLSRDGSTVTWLRGGTSPEVWRASFDASTNNGNDWFSLGEGSRIAGGWQLTGVSVANNADLRARGSVSGGFYNGSSWFVETVGAAMPPLITSQPASSTNNVGTTASFSVEADGNLPLSYQWLFNNHPLPGASNALLVLDNVQPAQEGGYAVTVSNSVGSVTSSIAMLTVNEFPVADASATQPVWMSTNGIDAIVELDGSRSSDPDGDPLTYLWRSSVNAQPPTALATGVVAVVSLQVGLHVIDLVVDDGLGRDTNTIRVSVSVLSAEQALEQLIRLVNESDLEHKQPLLASLEAALASVQRGNSISAVNQLHAFQNKVRAQVYPDDPVLAMELIEKADQVIDALSGERAPQTAGRIHSLKRHPNGKMRVAMDGVAGQVYVVEASTNLVDWEVVGTASLEADGTFVFEDPDAATHPSRFYRVVKRE